MTADFPASCRQLHRQDEGAAQADFDAVVTSNRIFVDRLRRHGRDRSRDVSSSYARHRPDPALDRRVPLDIRKSAAVSRLRRDRLRRSDRRRSGDNYDRYLVCVEEIHQSAPDHRAVPREARGRSAPGPVNVFDPSVRWPAKGGVFNRMEAADPAVQVRHGGSPGSGRERATSAIESANGELGFYLVSDGIGGAREGPLSSAESSSTWPPCPEMLKGALLADLIPTFDFINMIGGECDR